MFGMGFGELMLIALIALLFVGPDKLPEAAKKISQGIRDLRKQTKNLQTTIEQDTQLGGAMREIKSALRGEEPRRPVVRTGLPAKPATPAIAAKTGDTGTPGAAATGDTNATAPTGAPAPAGDAKPGAATSPSDAGTPPEATAASPEATPSRGDGAARADGAGAGSPASDEVRDLAARMIRPASATVPQAARPAAADATDSTDADDPGTPAAGSGSAHG